MDFRNNTLLTVVLENAIQWKEGSLDIDLD